MCCCCWINEKILRYESNKKKKKKKITGYIKSAISRSKSCTYTRQHPLLSLFFIVNKHPLDQDMDSVCKMFLIRLLEKEYKVLAAQSHSPSSWSLDCITTSNQAPGLIFSQLYIELLSRKWLKYIFCCIASVKYRLLGNIKYEETFYLQNLTFERLLCRRCTYVIKCVYGSNTSFMVVHLKVKA